MTKDQLYAIISTEFRDSLNESKLDLADISSQASLIQLGIADSMQIVRLLLSIEAQSGIELDFSSMDPNLMITLSGLEQLFVTGQSEL